MSMDFIATGAIAGADEVSPPGSPSNANQGSR